MKSKLVNGPYFVKSEPHFKLDLINVKVSLRNKRKFRAK